MELFHEAGVFAWMGLAVFTLSLVRLVTRPSNALRNACVGAVMVISIGMVGSSLGQRLVDRALQEEPSLERRVVLLSAGTRETSANLLLAGLFSLVLVGVGAGVSAARFRE